jgi:hypothetical protein
MNDSLMGQLRQHHSRRRVAQGCMACRHSGAGIRFRMRTNRPMRSRRVGQRAVSGPGLGQEKNGEKHFLCSIRQEM